MICCKEISIFTFLKDFFYQSTVIDSGRLWYGNNKNLKGPNCHRFRDMYPKKTVITIIILKKTVYSLVQ